MSDWKPITRCVCSHPLGIHIGGETCARGCRCWNGRFSPSAAGYTKNELRYWERWLAEAAA